MIQIDCLGQVCPIPVIRAKKALEGLGESGGVVTVLVDNDMSRQNLEKMAKGLGYQSEYLQKEGGVIEVTIAAGEGCAVEAPAAEDQGGLVVAIGRDTMGEGSEELGRILLKGFIFALKELSPPPAQILFFNSGASLTCLDSNSLQDLLDLADTGTLIQTCGTCLNYYNLTDKLAVGEAVNMYTIVTAMDGAKRLINL